MFGWFNKEINSLADLQGLKMRIPSLGGEVFVAPAGVPVTMQVSEVFTALQTGALDATEFVSPYNDLAAGYHTVAITTITRAGTNQARPWKPSSTRNASSPTRRPAGHPDGRRRGHEPDPARRTHGQE